MLQAIAAIVERIAFKIPDRRRMGTVKKRWLPQSPVSSDEPPSKSSLGRSRSGTRLEFRSINKASPAKPHVSQINESVA